MKEIPHSRPQIRIQESAHVYITVAEAARRLGVSVSFVRKLIRKGRLPIRRIRGTRLVRLHIAELDGLFDETPSGNPAKATE